MNNEELSTAAKSFGIEKLSLATGLSRSNIYDIINGRTSPRLSTYKKLIEPLGLSLLIQKKQPQNEEHSIDYIRWSLAYYGAPIGSEDSFTQPIPINDLLIKSLTEGRKNASINTILPIFIYTNHGKFNWPKIIRNTSDRRYLSYLLNIIFHITNDLKINKILADLQADIKPMRTELLIRKKNLNSFEKRFFSTVDNKISKAWKYQTADNLSDIKARFLKWQGLAL